jgi:hypothetical protein
MPPVPKNRLPDLPDTGRQYVEHTIRARLASPGIEKYRAKRGGGGARIVVAVLAVAALVAAMVWYARLL